MNSTVYNCVALPLDFGLDRKPKIPLTRVELHCHFDGVIRPETAWELTQNRTKTLDEFKRELRISEPKDLAYFLEKFAICLPPLVGNLDNIKRVAVEFCQDSARNGVAYVEARYPPQLLATDRVKPDDVVRAVTEGFDEGQRLYGVKAKSILCLIAGQDPEISKQTLDLCLKFKGDVVGIDVEDDLSTKKLKGTNKLGETEKMIFNEAKRLNIHRTSHAGEDGPAENIRFAVEEMQVERIGHGYQVVTDPKVYELCKQRNIHFEMCPTSSITTGAVDAGMAATYRHPILTLAKDDMNFGINTDCPTVSAGFMNDEIELLRTWGMSEAHIVRATVNAARSCFLPEQDKRELIQDLSKQFGFTSLA